jgi:hypothetical protein
MVSFFAAPQRIIDACGLIKIVPAVKFRVPSSFNLRTAASSTTREPISAYLVS